MSRGDLFAVIGNPVLHSRSPEIFRSAFNVAGKTRAVYTRIAAVTAEEAIALARELGMQGLNVTSPFKEAVLPLVDELDESARSIAAVNTILFTESGLKGFNTDHAGVAEMLRWASVDPRRASIAIIGAGGAAAAAARALEQLGAQDVVIASRTQARATRIADARGFAAAALDDAQTWLPQRSVIIHCLPRAVHLEAWQGLREHHIVLDANYGETPLAQRAREVGCTYIDGRAWLIGQALESYRLFTGTEASVEAMRRALDVWQQRPLHIVLAGIMGSGKTAVGRTLAGYVKRDFIDTDGLIEAQCGMSTSEIFAQNGEEAFRAMEVEAVREAVAREPAIIALGGGALMNAMSSALIAEKGMVVWLWADPAVCATRADDGTRPLLHVDHPAAELGSILERRFERYALASDLIISSAGTSPEEIARKIADEAHHAKLA